MSPTSGKDAAPSNDSSSLTTPDDSQYPPDRPDILCHPRQLSAGNEESVTLRTLEDGFRSIGDANRGFQKYEDSKSVRLLNETGIAASELETHVATTQSSVPPTKTVYESDAMKAVREGVNTVIDSLPGLVKALDEVAKLHPFIGIAVSAFRVVVELDAKRRDNDKKIELLFDEMKDMMEALLQ
ncbi:hypothetical protein K466DRAFT_598154 [Polyporus arcularius HHB13444]|uniref:Fungal STAND N-terminal Goodbye domain-containing protein n=1 Tax=Polyporus arcularius HHB13444 TaxID=1314778 RepID=A0A5C3PLC6_9APHY|nr:hypothetical protein K466DRAFT_598154 [Polyporus arcularius HHB13444]